MRRTRSSRASISSRCSRTEFVFPPCPEPANATGRYSHYSATSPKNPHPYSRQVGISLRSTSNLPEYRERGRRSSAVMLKGRAHLKNCCKTLQGVALRGGVVDKSGLCPGAESAPVVRCGYLNVKERYGGSRIADWGRRRKGCLVIVSIIFTVDCCYGRPAQRSDGSAAMQMILGVFSRFP
jgi:hypothetical protein